MRIIQRAAGGIVICDITGEINANTRYTLRDELTAVIAKKSYKVLLNFKEVEYIDSTGMAMLAQFSLQLKSLEGELALCQLLPKLGSVVRILKMGKVFRVFPTETEALQQM